MPISKLRKRQHGYDYSIVWKCRKGYTNWDVYNHYDEELAVKLCKSEKDFKELLHVSQYPISPTDVKKRNKILAKGGVYPNGR